MTRQTLFKSERCQYNIRYLLLLTSLGGWLYAQNVQTVTGEGMGMTHDAALSAAKRNAVENGVGVIVASETLVKNFVVAEDRILSKANGFVKTYEELSSSQGPDGLYTVTISAVVTDILDEVVKDQLALDLLLSWVRHPRFLIMVDERNIDDPNSIVAETEIGRLMGAKGFDIVSPSQTEALKQRKVNLASIQENPDQAAGMAAEFGAEYIILGKASSKATTHPMLGSRLSGQANISAQVIRADNAQVIAQETFHGKSTHIEAHTAGVNALRGAAEKLSEYLLSETVKRWSLEQSNARLLTLRISGVTYQTRRQIIEILKSEIEGIQSVDQRSFSAGTVTLAVQYAGSNEDLGAQLDGKDFGAYALFIVGETPNGFDLSAQAK
ncbi:MAG: hypothetical protein JSU77_11775 [Fidelibacterota bacterium]|nr:MAG: hypothetical protein JSU77_11775 [Candidatus Neomarinimicrobiota bacterium]